MHDFRVYYHTSYFEVDEEEAVLLISKLPKGSLYMGSISPRLSWSDEREDLADIKDLLLTLYWGMCLDKEKVPQPNAVTRPWQIQERIKKKSKAKSVKERIQQSEWEAIDG